MIVLGIETSCDETSAAVVRDGEILANVVSSQTTLHAEYGGVVPELATREHLKNLLPVIRAALARAGVAIAQIDIFAATQGPGLPAALMAGFQATQAAAFALSRPLYGINHHEAHLYSPWITGTRAQFELFEPNLSLIVSGGHTLLVHVRAEFDHLVLGGTIDDAAGECFDKSAKLLNLPYPGGPELDRLARAGNPKAIKFPRPLLSDPGDDFSFSGLKTAVKYYLADHPHSASQPDKIADLCASVQAAIVEVLVEKTIRAARRVGVHCVTASGGVTCNSALRTGLETATRRHGLTLRIAEREYCTDNAAMVAMLAWRKALRGLPPATLAAEASPAIHL